MFKQKINYFVFVSIIILFYSLSAYDKLIDPDREINTPSDISAPHSFHKLLFTINANYAIILKNGKSHYQLILIHPDVLMNYSNHQLDKSGSYPLPNFIHAWQSKNNLQLEADITGIQVDNKTFGHTQFYASVLLENPTYNTITDKLMFDMTPVKPNIKMDKQSRFDNATVFINGCGLCHCNDKDIVCDNL